MKKKKSIFCQNKVESLYEMHMEYINCLSTYQKLFIFKINR